MQKLNSTRYTSMQFLLQYLRIKLIDCLITNKNNYLIKQVIKIRIIAEHFTIKRLIR